MDTYNSEHVDRNSCIYKHIRAKRLVGTLAARTIAPQKTGKQQLLQKTSCRVGTLLAVVPSLRDKARNAVSLGF